MPGEVAAVIGCSNCLSVFWASVARAAADTIAIVAKAGKIDFIVCMDPPASYATTKMTSSSASITSERPAAPMTNRTAVRFSNKWRARRDSGTAAVQRISYG